MSKGIVVETPTPTHDGELKVAEADNGEVEWGTRLYFKHIEGLDWNLLDAVEFNITSQTNCDTPKKLTPCKGSVTLVPPDNRGGKVAFQEPIPNNYGLNKDDEIWFQFMPPIPDPPPAMKDGDILEIIVTKNKGGVFVKVLESK